MSEPRRDGFQIFLIVASLALAVLVVLLTVENRRLRAQLVASYEDIPADALGAGDVVGALELLDEAGSPVTLDPGRAEGGTFLLLFSSQCPACEQTLPIWSELFAEEAGPDAPQVVAVQLDREADGSTALVGAAYPFPVYGLSENGLGDDLRGKIPYIPAVALVEAGGTVAETWYGVPEDHDLEAMRAARVR